MSTPEIKRRIRELEAQGFKCHEEREELVCETEQSIDLPSMKVGIKIRIPKRELDKLKV